MERKAIHSPAEVEENGWRGRVGDVTRIGTKAGVAATLALALLVGLIVYGISTAGHRRPTPAQSATLTKANEQHQKPWWSSVPDAPAAPPILPNTVATPSSRIRGNSHSVTPQVPEVAPISPQTQALDAEREREARVQALRDAAQTAPIAVRLNDGTGVDAPAPGESGQSALPPSVPALAALGATPRPQDTDTRHAFLASAANATPDRMLALRVDDPSTYELHAGSVIPAILITGINADLPGTIVAQVRDDVLDSLTGRYVLIPRATKLVGTYDSRIVQGQRRVLVAWTRLLYPDGSSIDLPGMTGTDPEGYAGLGGNVDDHLSKTINAALLLSIISAGAQLSQPQQSAGFGAAPSIGQTLAGTLGQQIGNTSVQLTQRQLQLAPTLVVPPGYLFDVMVDRDLILEGPYGGAP